MRFGNFGNFGGVTRLPNPGKFANLHAAVRSFNSAVAQHAFIAADSFDMAIVTAAKQDKRNFAKFFSTGVSRAAQLTPHLADGRVSAMYAWLMRAQAHSKRTSDLHFKRTEQQQAQYNVGAQGAARVKEDIQRKQAGLPPLPPARQGESFAQVASGIAAILTPLAQAGAKGYAASLQPGGAPAPAAGGGYYPPPAQKSNTGLIVGVGVAVVAIVAIVVLGGKKKAAPAPAARKRKKRKR